MQKRVPLLLAAGLCFATAAGWVLWSFEEGREPVDSDRAPASAAPAALAAREIESSSIEERVPSPVVELRTVPPAAAKRKEMLGEGTMDLDTFALAYLSPERWAAQKAEFTRLNRELHADGVDLYPLDLLSRPIDLSIMEPWERLEKGLYAEVMLYHESVESYSRDFGVVEFKRWQLGENSDYAKRSLNPDGKPIAGEDLEALNRIEREFSEPARELLGDRYPRALAAALKLCVAEKRYEVLPVIPGILLPPPRVSGQAMIYNLKTGPGTNWHVTLALYEGDYPELDAVWREFQDLLRRRKDTLANYIANL